MSDLPIERLDIEANGLRFAAAASGAADAPLLLLLHGFPDSAYGWRRHLAPLAARGWRAVAPEQRGYPLSSKPDGVSAYRLDLLVADVLAIADALGHARFALVGHDWGGIVAWRVAAEHARRVERLVILNAPNLDLGARALLADPSQILRSAYVGFFQMPLVPELVLAANRHALLANALTWSSASGTFTPHDVETYRDGWATRGALTGMLNWYRALSLDRPRPERRITPPTTILWGDRDAALSASLADRCLALCDRGRLERFPTATHWLHQERALDVVDRIGAPVASTSSS